MATDVPPEIPPHTVDLVIETDPPVHDIPPSRSPRRTTEVKLPRALARLQPFNKLVKRNFCHQGGPIRDLMTLMINFVCT